MVMLRDKTLAAEWWIFFGERGSEGFRAFQDGGFGPVALIF
jgi:hypothetical protein